ncbi:hypothetical protein C1H46_008591 [Malus baccata]|uniref:Uncharacterized protein n=1 Tax=Malus baccata TaxID=106549 RepID=A0A540N3Y6_MALBA|nr:hypothetical protein C1H46_008591 [Malus baccata]
MPYLKGYETPNLVLFDGNKGSPKEHISYFIDTLGPHHPVEKSVGEVRRFR